MSPDPASPENMTDDNTERRTDVNLDAVAEGEIHCRRCDAPRPPLPKPPFRDERGARIVATICSICWGEWLKHQTALINHYGLDPRDSESRAFLYTQIDEVLLGDGTGESVDTSKEGSIAW